MGKDWEHLESTSKVSKSILNSIFQLKDELNKKNRGILSTLLAPKDEFETTAESHTEVSLKIQNLGTYNADNETFPITILDVTKNIAIPRKDAKSFKENWQSAEVRAVKQLMNDLETYEHINIEIFHPLTGDTFKFEE